MIQLVQLQAGWWSAIVGLAVQQSPGLKLLDLDGFEPEVDLWRDVPLPELYEQAHRERMAISGNLKQQERASNRRPVEGATEVDIVFESSEFLVFVEAKLDSDISMQSKNDPYRNQIERNIDCVLETAGSRVPLFWMFVKDRKPECDYARVVESYRADIGQLQSRLPHRDAERVKMLVDNIAIIEWREFLPFLPSNDFPERVVKSEIGLRAG